MSFPHMTWKKKKSFMIGLYKMQTDRGSQPRCMIWKGDWRNKKGRSAILFTVHFTPLSAEESYYHPGNMWD